MEFLLVTLVPNLEPRQTGMGTKALRRLVRGTGVPDSRHSKLCHLPGGDNQIVCRPSCLDPSGSKARELDHVGPALGRGRHAVLRSPLLPGAHHEEVSCDLCAGVSSGGLQPSAHLAKSIKRRAASHEASTAYRPLARSIAFRSCRPQLFNLGRQESSVRVIAKVLLACKLGMPAAAKQPSSQSNDIALTALQDALDAWF